MTIAELIRQIAKQEIPYSTLASVDKVEGQYCTVTFLENDLQVEQVRLSLTDKPDKLIIPKIKSIVVCTALQGNDWIVSEVSEIDKIVFFGGKRGGMLYSDKVLPLLEELTAKIKSIENIINGAPVVEAGNGSPSGLQMALKTALQAIVKEPLKDFENKKLLQ